MKGYTFTDRDIKVLVGAAGNAVCEDRVFPESMDPMVMEVSCEIAIRLIRHLSGADTFSEDVLELLSKLFESRDL